MSFCEKCVVRGVNFDVSPNVPNANHIPLARVVAASGCFALLCSCYAQHKEVMQILGFVLDP